jgi:hypothetical protein
MVELFYACADNKCKVAYKDASTLFDALLDEYGMMELSKNYLAEIVQKSGLVQKSQEIKTPSEGEIKEKTWNK